MNKSPTSSTASRSAYTPEQSRDAVNYPQSVSWSRLIFSKPRSASASSTYAHPDSPSATPSSTAATSANPESPGGLSTSHRKYGYAAVNATAMGECRELYQRQKASLMDFKIARESRRAALADVKAFREKHGLTAEQFQKYGSYRAGKRPLPTWLCKCGVENHENAKACEECGRLKP
jgi:hypothetical protein